MAKKRKNGKAGATGDHNGEKSSFSASTNKNGTVSTPDDGASSSRKKDARRPFESFPLHLLSNDHWKASPPLTSSRGIQELVPGRVLIVPEFFTPKECQEWVTFCETSGGLEYTAHPATKFVAHRECFRLQQANANVLARRLYERLKTFSSLLPMIQREMNVLYKLRSKNNDPKYEPVGCNPNLRVYKYEKGHSFGKHVDGSNLVVADGDNSLLLGGQEGGKTEWTVLIYLSECQGGATRFYTDTPRSNKRKNHPTSVAFEPRVGAMLLHLHGDYCLEHEADPVLGGTKFVLRTDLVFGNSPPPPPSRC